METTRSPVLERAHADIRSGRLWKARDRLAVAIKHDPTNQQLLDLLGKVHFEMRDLPAAGRFWILTDRADADADAALSAFEERWGANLGEKLKMVPFEGSAEAYPPTARERIRLLLEQAEAAEIEWPRKPADPPDWPDIDDADSSIRTGLILTALGILGPGLWLFGLVAASYLLFNWIF